MIQWEFYLAKRMLSDTQKEAMMGVTRDAALVLVDDLQHIRQIVRQEEPNPGDLRRLSNQLRRILVEGDLLKIAAPRMGKIVIVGPDLRALYRANEQSPFLFAAADEFSTHGIVFSSVLCDEGKNARSLPNYDPDIRLTLRVEPFQNQKVLCFRGRWITRADLIKYVANVASGIHSGSPKEEVEFLIRKIRSGLIVRMVPGPDGMPAPSIEFNQDALAAEDSPIQFKSGVTDLALLNIISTAQFLITSPNVIELENMITTTG
jgi:hypothetical protein